jgi:hypothetical protein
MGEGCINNYKMTINISPYGKSYRMYVMGCSKGSLVVLGVNHNFKSLFMESESEARDERTQTQTRAGLPTQPTDLQTPTHDTTRVKHWSQK